MAKETTLLLSAVATIPLHTYILALTLHGGAPAGWALACHRLIPMVFLETGMQKFDGEGSANRWATLDSRSSCSQII